MDKHVAGDRFAYTAAFPVEPAETGLALSTRCVREGLELVRRLLGDAVEGAIPLTPQDLSARRYFHRGPPQDASWTGAGRRLRGRMGLRIVTSAIGRSCAKRVAAGLCVTTFRTERHT